MADFDQAVAKTLAAEGGFFYNHTTGEVVNMGVTLSTLRSLGILHSSGPPTESDVAFVKSLTEAEAKDIYRSEYWDKIHGDNFDSQDVAAKVFDLAVNTGLSQASKILQRACGVTADGVIGNVTLAAANAEDPGTLLAAIRAQGTQFYQEIASTNPALAGNLPGWMSRLNS